MSVYGSQTIAKSNFAFKQMPVSSAGYRRNMWTTLSRTFLFTFLAIHFPPDNIHHIKLAGTLDYIREWQSIFGCSLSVSSHTVQTLFSSVIAILISIISRPKNRPMWGHPPPPHSGCHLSFSLWSISSSPCSCPFFVFKINGYNNGMYCIFCSSCLVQLVCMAWEIHDEKMLKGHWVLSGSTPALKEVRSVCVVGVVVP